MSTKASMHSADEMISWLPIRLRWNGWESDTETLKHFGWNLCRSKLERDPRDYKLRVLLSCTDPDKRLCLMGNLDIPMEFIAAFNTGARMVHRLQEVTMAGADLTKYQISDRAIVHSRLDWRWESAYELISFDGSMGVKQAAEYWDFKDLVVFKEREAPKDIIIPAASVDDCLNHILKLQHPEAEKYKARQKKGELVTVPQAKIYTLAA